eukprot:scaffold128366_cov45-Prasinocladus_malaysianus.AAC.1
MRPQSSSGFVGTPSQPNPAASYATATKSAVSIVCGFIWSRRSNQSQWSCAWYQGQSEVHVRA